MLSVFRNIGHSAALNLALAMVIVGSSVVCGKIITRDFPLFLASELRFLIAAGLFLPLGIYRHRLFQRPRHDILILAAMAFCGQILFTILLLLGLRYTSGVSAGTLTSTTPFFMALFSFFVLGERFSRRQLAGLLLAGSCIFLLGFDTFCALPGADGRQGLGNLLVLAAVASEAVFLLFGKKLQVPLPGLAMTALLSLLGAAFCLPPALYEARDFDFAALTGEDMAAMLYFGAVYTDVAYLFWFRGAARTTGAEASTFTVLMPLSASLLSTCLLGESISGLQATALLLAVGSILLLTVGSKGQAEIADERGDCPEAK